MSRPLATALVCAASIWATTSAPQLAKAQATAPATPPTTTPAAVPAPAAAPAPAPVAAPPVAPAAAPVAPADPNAPQGRTIWLRTDEDSQEQEEEDALAHRGLFARMTAGMGIGHVSGKIGPEPGFKPIDRLSHTAPVLGVAAHLGGGFENFALAGELMYERMLTRVMDPSRVSFSLFGAGINASAYFRDDWFVTGHVRWLVMMLWKSGVPCWYNRADATTGPGIGLTLGKEWYGHRHRHERYQRDREVRDGQYRDEAYRERDDDYDRGDGGIGVALQGNYASLSGNPDLDYLSGLLVLTLTHF